MCPYYLAGFCPDARRTPNGIAGTGQRAYDVGCDKGIHAKWVEDAELKRPEVRVVKSREEEERERLEREGAMERELEREAKYWEDQGRDTRDGQGRNGQGQTGKGQGRRGRKNNYRQRRNNWN